jgi:hypothetical protein
MSSRPLCGGTQWSVWPPSPWFRFAAPWASHRLSPILGDSRGALSGRHLHRLATQTYEKCGLRVCAAERFLVTADLCEAIFGHF